LTHKIARSLSLIRIFVLLLLTHIWLMARSGAYCLLA
jgi:hypothetical protein